MDSSRQLFVRTNPCAGAVGSSGLARNQGKQIGIPPRIAWPSCQRDGELRKRTSSCPAGFQEVTWAPCRYISPSAFEPVIRIRSRPPLPSQILATPGIPKRRSSSSAAGIVSILLPYQGSKRSVIASIVPAVEMPCTQSKRNAKVEKSVRRAEKLHVFQPSTVI